MKYFIITVDTEGDNLWDWEPGAEIKTENAKCIPQFQELCEKFAMPPVYLVNYEMAMDASFAKYIGEKALHRRCEIGMHLHAWNSPPDYELPKRYNGNPYIIEYPKEVIIEKHTALKKILEDRFNSSIVSYRSGRWASNEVLYDVLTGLGFLVDCSVTPQISHAQLHGMSISGGSDYKESPLSAYMINNSLMEVPMTTRWKRSLHGVSLKNRVKNLVIGKSVWMRPAVQTFEDMKNLVSDVEKDGSDYVEFMIHSSELMPKGSPYCQTQEDIRVFYSKMEQVFSYMKDHGYSGITLHDYYNSHIAKLNRKQ